ncbi:Hypothetical predicted protein [Lecanosticta acicola]|uniref:SprT-like domain-containing protein n=1 Tax=Lecanosticta acicola TaxID=111012 RepID=A0AAI8YR67_9PEZI|nr:Hypothetical predicted protein [Lecanosticta acicola]
MASLSHSAMSPEYQTSCSLTNPYTTTIEALMACKPEPSSKIKRKSNRLALEYYRAKLRKEDLLLSLQRHQRRTQLQGCYCPECRPHLYRSLIHPDDHKEFSPIRGFRWQSHDAWHLAVTLSTHLERPTPPESIQRWKTFQERHRPNVLQRSVPETFQPGVLNDVVSIFSDIFFAGQLPSSKLHIFWAHIDEGAFGRTHGSTSKQVPPLLILNKSHVEMQINMRRVLRVILHEMVHVFFGLYTCYPWCEAKISCARGDCGKLYTGNLGLSGHGRAWQYLTKAIEAKLPSVLGLKGPLGCHDGVVSELERRASAPCSRDRRKHFPALTLVARGIEVRTKDDDETLRKRMAFCRRSCAWAISVRRGTGRRYSI